VNETRFASLPPTQIVPTLADEGRYVASESRCTAFCARRNNWNIGERRVRR
jgi:hypothetical protein